MPREGEHALSRWARWARRYAWRVMQRDACFRSLALCPCLQELVLAIGQKAKEIERKTKIQRFTKETMQYGRSHSCDYKHRVLPKGLLSMHTRKHFCIIAKVINLTRRGSSALQRAATAGGAGAGRQPIFFFNRLRCTTSSQSSSSRSRGCAAPCGRACPRTHTWRAMARWPPTNSGEMDYLHYESKSEVGQVVGSGESVGVATRKICRPA